MEFDFNAHTHRRFNPLLKSWVMVAPHRTQRPWQGAEESEEEKPPEYDPKCFLCPGNKRANGSENPNYTTTFIFENDFAAVKQNQPELAFTLVNEEEVKKGGAELFGSEKLSCRQEYLIATNRRCLRRCTCYLL